MQELPCYRACNELREKTNKMAREYIKLPNGTLQEIDRARVREFASVECVKKAIADGDLQPGDTWATICHTTPITEDIAAEVYRILSYVPETTNSTDNKLLNHCDLTAEMEEIAKRAMCCDFQAYVETAGVAITDRVCCGDYNTCVGNMQSAITTLEGKAGLDCVGTVTSITVNGASYNPTSGVVSLPNYPPDLSSCAGLACTGNVTSADIANFITMADVNACNYTTMAAVNACGYTTCQGTVVASDIANFITMADVNACNYTTMAAVNACGYTTCTGTVVASDIANFITMADVNACGYTTCTGTLTASDIANFITMADVNACNYTTMAAVNLCGYTTCTGTLTASDISDMATQTWVNNCGFSKATFSLSGNVLTITTA